MDLAHLSRQTMGDRSLEQEVLCMFMHQAQTVRERLRAATPQERRSLAHGLKGSARGIGAFRVADAADAVEGDPSDAARFDGLDAAVDEVRQFIAAINR